jgi:hypothetical protein
VIDVSVSLTVNLTNLQLTNLGLLLDVAKVKFGRGSMKMNPFINGLSVKAHQVKKVDGLIVIPVAM